MPEFKKAQACGRLIFSEKQSLFRSNKAIFISFIFLKIHNGYMYIFNIIKGMFVRIKIP